MVTWSPVKLNNGRAIPSIAFGSWPHLPADTADMVVMALKAGFRHLDTAQNYGYEAGVGKGLRKSGIPRSSVWITTKWSGQASIRQSMKDSLKNLETDYVDLYLIHNPRFPGGDDVEGNWREMELLVKEGKARSIGVSNHSLEQLQRLMAMCDIKPVVNQIWLHPGNYISSLPLMSYMAEHGIIAEAYSPLWPLKGGRAPAVVSVVEAISAGKQAQPEQVLLSWSRAKGFLPVTTTGKKERAVGYMAAGDIILSDEDIKRIDGAGAAGFVVTT